MEMVDVLGEAVIGMGVVGAESFGWLAVVWSSA